MVDFSNLKRQQVSAQSTAKFELFDIEGMEGAALIVVPATRTNKPYQAKVVKIMAPHNRRLASGKVSADFINSFRDTQKDLYAEHVVKGWENIHDAQGNAAPFTKENCKSFLEALPSHLFDQLVGFCEDDSNFRDYAPEDVAKN